MKTLNNIIIVIIYLLRQFENIAQINGQKTCHITITATHKKICRNVSIN